MINKIKKQFPSDHEQCPGLVYEYQKDDDGTERERSYKKGTDQKPDWKTTNDGPNPNDPHGVLQ